MGLYLEQFVTSYIHSSMIYFIKAENGRVKIGYSKAPDQRLQRLQQNSPVSLSLEAYAEGNRSVESALHRRFKSQRLHGEWFDLSSELASLVQQVRDSNNAHILLDYCDTFLPKSDALRLRNTMDRQSMRDELDELDRIKNAADLETPIRNNRKARLDNWQKQITLGALLGKANLQVPEGGKNPRLLISHGKRDDWQWFQWKIEVFQRLGHPHSLARHGDYGYRWWSICHPVWSELYQICYPHEGKQITMEWLDRLQDVAWAVWFLDKGTWIDGNLRLNLHSWPCKDVSIAAEYFNQLDVTCRPEGLRVIDFTSEGTYAFFKIAAPQIPLFLKYRLESR